jgi:hypothetical protein
MTWAKRVSALPGEFYLADPKQVTPLPDIGSIGLRLLLTFPLYSIFQFL